MAETGPSRNAKKDLTGRGSKRKKVLTDKEIQDFIDALDKNDGNLTESDIESFEDSGDEEIYEMGNEVGIAEEDSGEEGEVGNGSASEDEDEQERVPLRREMRKQIFKNLDDRLDDTNYDDLPAQEDETYVYVSRDKKTTVTWKTNQVTTGRMPSRNVIRNRPGATSLTRNAKTPVKAWQLFITNRMIEAITLFTNKRIDDFRERFQELLEQSNKYAYYERTNENEIRALLGLFYLRGALKLNLRKTNDVFYHKSSNDVFSATMNVKRFQFLCRFLAFDDFTTRRERWQSNRFAAFREFLEDFNERCARMRNPSEYLSIDETLYPYRGNVKFRQYNPSKPARYGLLYRSISDSRVPYTYFTLAYAGKPESQPDQFYVTGTDNYTKYLVDSLKQYVQLRRRNIPMDRYFTSLPVAEYLLENDITVVGTLRSHRIGLPKELTDVKDRDDLSVKYAFPEDGNIMLVSYVVKKKSGKRNILMLTTMHKSVKITCDSRKKPNVITLYDCTKGGVDVMDMISSNLSTRIQSRRWLLNALAFVLDTARSNAQTILKDNNNDGNRSSFQFAWEIGESLIRPHILSRYKNPVGLQVPVLKRIQRVLEIEEPLVQQKPPKEPTDRQRCYMCLQEISRTPNYKEKKDKLGKPKWVCKECKRVICIKHSQFICLCCEEKQASSNDQ